MDSSPLFFATSGLTKPQKHYFLLIFSIFPWAQQKVNDLLTSPNNLFRDYHTWNRIEQLMPQHWNFAPQTLRTLQKNANLFSNLDFLPTSGFPKTLDLSMDSPMIFHGFPTPWPGSLGRALSAGLSWPGSLTGKR